MADGVGDGEETASEAALRLATLAMGADDPDVASRQMALAQVLALLAVEERLGVLAASVDELVRDQRFGSR